MTASPATENTHTLAPHARPTLDSGQRQQFASGMLREAQPHRPRFDLLVPKDLPFEDQLLTRCAVLMSKGAAKYADRNWENANSEAEMERMKAGAFRHFMQWFVGETDEDHAAAVVFNIMAVETTATKMARAQRP